MTKSAVIDWKLFMIYISILSNSKTLGVYMSAYIQLYLSVGTCGHIIWNNVQSAKIDTRFGRTQSETTVAKHILQNHPNPANWIHPKSYLQKVEMQCTLRRWTLHKKPTPKKIRTSSQKANQPKKKQKYSENSQFLWTWKINNWAAPAAAINGGRAGAGDGATFGAKKELSLDFPKVWHLSLLVTPGNNKPVIIP